MSPAIPRKIIIGFGLGVAILAINAAIAVQVVVSLTEATQAVADGLRVRDLLKETRSLVFSSETGQRNYVLTGNKEYLELSLKSLKSTESQLNEILGLVDNDSTEAEKTGLLQSLIGARAALFERTLDHLRNGRKAAALQAMTAEAGKDNLNRTDELFDQLGASQGALFARRTDELQRNSLFSLVTFYVATFCGVVLLGLLCYFVYRDITERRRAEEKLRVVSTHDSLTALPNRTLLHERLSHALARAQRHGRQLALLFVGLDRFKTVNDTLGHEAGDTLLQVTALRLHDCLRETDTMARQGGDEFVVLMDELTDREPITRVSQRILDAVGQPFIIDGQEIHITASIGISVYPEDGRTLLRNADIAMERAKDKGKNNYQFYSTQMDNYSVERLSLESGLRRALEREEFTLHYQPKVNIATGLITGMEALLRWQHPELGSVAPGRFIPIAEETGLIQPIGAWVLKTACIQNRAWQRQGVLRFPVAVNLSSRQFAGETLLDDVKAALDASGLAAADLELEITESMVMNSPEQAVIQLRQLKELGVHVAIDDFGTGYSSLAYLKRFPIDSVKVDRSFVEDIPENVDSMAIAQAVIAMAHSLRLKVVAEGVESEAQLGFLCGEGCDEIQGYYFCEARPASEISEIMRRTLRRGNTVYLSERRRRA
ncbi:MAG TPA: EAL domain-containing protein [Burkholderiales bacterium]|nr:EAL domain-containing protein [Burkholderiales bacterium]